MVIKTFFYSMETTLISKKATLHLQHIFFVHLFAVVLDDYNVKLLCYTFYGGDVLLFLVHFFFHCRSFSPCTGGRQHFLFCHHRDKIFMLFFQQKMSRSRSLQIKIKIKTVHQIKSRSWEIKGGKYTKTLAKFQARGIFRIRDIRKTF